MDKFYEQYPWPNVIIANALSLSIVGIGAYLLSGWGWLWAGLYLLFYLGTLVNLWRGSCRTCYYYGKRCGTGMGRFCSWFFKAGDPKAFSSRETSWIQILPDIMILLIPLLAGIGLLIRQFTWLTLILLIVLLFLSFSGNGLVRSKLLCPHCQQRLLGCPAEKLFQKQNA